MLVRFVVRLAVLGAIIALAVRIVPGLAVHGSWVWYVWLAVIYSVINLILGPIFRLVSFPLIVLTLGLFLLVVNAAILEITAALSSHLTIDTFGDAILGGLVIAVFSWVAELVLPFGLRSRKNQRRAWNARQR